MATTKTLNTRIQLKYDSYAEWTAKNPTLLQGEIAIAYLGPTKDDNTVTPDNGTHPVLFKVGPGEFNSLPWASALAADVHSWAKAATKPKYTASEIEGLDEYIAGEIQDTDTDTRYSFEVTSEGKLKVTKTLYTLGVAGAPEEVGQYDFVTPDELENILKEYYTKAEVDAAIKAEADRAKGIEDGLAQRVKAIEDAPYASQGYVDNAISTLENGQVKTNKEAIETLNGADTVEGSVAKAIKDARVLISAEIDADVKVATDAIAAMDKAYKEADTELSGRIKALEDVSHDFAGADAALKADLEGQISSAKSEALAADETFAISYANKTITLTGSKGTNSTIDASDFVKDGMIDSVALSEDGKNLVITWNTDAGKDAVTIPLTGLVDIYTGVDGENVKVAVSSDNKISADLTDKVKESLTKANTAVQPAALNSYYTKEQADAAFMDSTETSSAIDAKIAALKLGETYQAKGDYKTVQTAVVDPTASGNALAFIDSISQNTNGEITATKKSIDLSNYLTKTSGIIEESYIADEAVTKAKIEKAFLEEIEGKANDADLAAIAKSGNVNDLVQGKNEVLVFNCGSASTVF